MKIRSFGISCSVNRAGFGWHLVRESGQSFSFSKLHNLEYLRIVSYTILLDFESISLLPNLQLLTLDGFMTGDISSLSHLKSILMFSQ